MNKPGRFNKRPATFWLVFFSLVLAVLIFFIHLYFFSFVQDEEIRLAFSDISSPIINALSTAALFIAAWQSRKLSKRIALAWGILGLAQFTYMIGDSIWSFYELILKESPFPSIADIAYLSYYPLFIIGIFYLPFKKYSSSEWIKILLEIGAVMMGAILFYGNYLIGPLLAGNSDQPALTQFLVMAYPIGDLVMLCGLLILLYRKVDRQNGFPVLLICLGILSLVITDSIFGLQSLSGAFVSGGVLDLGWVFYYLMLGLAGVWQIYTVQTARGKHVFSQPLIDNLKKLQVILNYLPYFWLAAAFFLMIQAHFYSLPMGFLNISGGVAVIIGLLMVNQIATLIENNRLNHQLTRVIYTVQNQADELSKTNHNLESEIVERKTIEKQLAHDALHDGLTGLANRVLLLDRLGQAVEYSRKRKGNSFSVLFLDLDQFKVINDSLGHSMGDQMLKLLSNRLKGQLRASDTIARLGGDEFVILLENTNDESTVTLAANRIQKEIMQPFHLDGHEIFVTASMGIVQTLVDYDRAEDVLRDADIAMYRAKALGKARYEIFSDVLRKQAVTRLKLENELRQAIEHQEFFLEYQPIFSLQTNQTIAFEALIRWNHPQRGILNPGEFIQVAEESGLILPIGQWVLSEACFQLRRWHAQFPDQHTTSIQVNISGKQFTQLDFVEQVETILQATGIKPTSLRLEITESVLIENQVRANDYLTELSKIGVQLHIDDFGTGYSSLSYVQNFPINTIKIDKSFVQEIGKSKKSSELIRAIVSMAREMGMETTAEGIETSEQLNELRKLSCTNGQGFLFSKPIDHLAVTKYLEKKQQNKPETRPLRILNPAP